MTPAGLRYVTKHGSTWHVGNRKGGAITYFPMLPKYLRVIVLDPTAFPDPQRLYEMDAEFVEYLETQQLGHLHVKGGGGTEWFFHDSSVSLHNQRLAFFQSKQIPILAVYEGDPYPIHDLTPQEKQVLDNEDLEKKKVIPVSRLHELIHFQELHIQAIRNFLLNRLSVLAAMVIAVCGYGKTVVTVKSLKGIVNRACICVPTDYLKQSWKKALINYGGFSETEIFELGSGKTLPLQDILAKDRYVLLLCYASSHLLLTELDTRCELSVFDEGHRLAGIAELETDDPDQKADVGRTKRLVRRCKELNIPRLTLTYTPKSYLDEDFDGTLNSNDDVELFGQPIVKVSLREMITKKLLPPYEIRFPHVKTAFEGTKAKVQLMLHEFMRQENGTYVMNHLVTFGASHEHCREILACMNELLPETSGIELVYLETAADVSKGLERFTKAERAICLNCKLLGEGVDIPIADSTCILSAKRSYTDLVQSLLRSGRHYPGKQKFYLIMTFTENDDADFIGFTLDALAQMDPYLDKQLLRLALNPTSTDPRTPDAISISESLNDPIQSDFADGHDLERIRRCIETVIKRRMGTITTRLQFERLRAACQETGILNTSHYNKLREQYSWPEAPWSCRDMSAYEFFRGVVRGPVSSDTFRSQMRDLEVPYESYEGWQQTHPEYPSIEDITDGYFGLERNLQDFFQLVRRRR